jgi:dTMP kinase
LLTRQPGGTEIGASIRELLLSTDTEGLSLRAEALLMAADRAQHVEELIRPTLDAGRHVVCDRYLASSLAYQGAGRELGEPEVRALSAFAVDGLLPDLILLLDVPAEVGLGRIDSAPDRLESLGGGFHDRVRASFLSQATADPQRWLVIDGTQPLDAVTAAVDAALQERLGWTL